VSGGILFVDDCLAPLKGEVAVKLEHGGASRNQLGTVHLNLITALRVQEPEAQARAVSSKSRVNVIERQGFTV
jgi:hypothetical protein